MTATPFQLPDERVEVQTTNAGVGLRQRLSGFARELGRTYGRLSFDWTAPKELRGAVARDARDRFSTPESVLEALTRYSPLHGGEQAETELKRLVALCERAHPVPAYRRLLRHAGRKPAEIVRYVRESTLHVDAAPAVVSVADSVRAFHPLETAISGVGQCTGAATLAAALIETAGYRAYLWAVPGHSFLAWQTKGDRWQLEDVDLFPPEVALPRGLSMTSLLESYDDWAPILDALPTMNVNAPSGCFVPTDGGQLHAWHQRLANPADYDRQQRFEVGSRPRQRRDLRVRVGGPDEPGCLRVDNPNPEALLMMVCDRPFSGCRPAKLDAAGVQHDVFRFAQARGYYRDHLAQVQKTLYSRIPAGAEALAVPLDGLAANKVSVFTLPPDSPRAEPFLIHANLTMSPAEESAESVPPAAALPACVERAQAAFDTLCEANATTVDAAAARYAGGTGPARAWQTLAALDLPPVRGRVLDAACGTGDFALALAASAGSVAAIDYTAGRIDFLRAALDRIAPRLPVEPFVGPVEAMPFEDRAFDWVFCRGAIFLTDLPRSLAEFHRVLTPGGRVYMDCNADAWNLHLMLERDGDAARQGRDTLYNTVWRRFAGTALPPLAESVSRRGLRVSPKAGSRNLDALLDEMDRHLRVLPADKAAQVRRLELRARQLCGEEHLPVILADMLSAAAGRQTGPSVTVGSAAWQPEEVEAEARRLEFVDFSWWSETGSRRQPGKRPLELGPQVADAGSARRHVRGALSTWHALFRKPES